MTILFMYVGDITSLLTEDKNKGTNNAEDWVNILQKIEPKEIVCQFEMILPQLKIISRKTSSGHFNLSAKSQSKCSSILYFVHCGRMAQPLPHTTSTPTHIITQFIISMHQLFVCTYSHALVIHSEQVIPTYWSYTQNKSFPCTGHSLRTIHSHASPSYITYLCLSMHWACSGGFSIYWPSCACFC